MKNRRTFLTKAATGLFVTGLLPLTQKSMASEVRLTGGLVHHVFFWLKEPENNEHRKQFEKALEELVKIETIKMSHIGIPASTAKRDVVDNSFTYSYMVIFDNQEGHDIYQNHPQHLKFVEKNSFLWEKVAVYDSFG